MQDKQSFQQKTPVSSSPAGVPILFDAGVDCPHACGDWPQAAQTHAIRPQTAET